MGYPSIDVSHILCLQCGTVLVIIVCRLDYIPTQRGHYHYGMFRNPTAAVNLFHVGKQYLTFWQAKAAVTRNLIGRKIISNVKRSDTRNVA